MPWQSWRRATPRSAPGLVVLCLALSATGCATPPEPVIQTRVERLQPPQALRPGCPTPPYRTATHGDLARAVVSLDLALAQCRREIDRYVEWGADEQ